MSLIDNLLEHENLGDYSLSYNCLEFEEYYQFEFNEKLKKKMKTFQKFVMAILTNSYFFLEEHLSQKDIDSSSNLNETLLSRKESFCGNLNLEQNSNSDYKHSRKIHRYPDLCIKINTMLPTDVFKETCFKNFDLNPCHFF